MNPHIIIVFPTEHIFFLLVALLNTDAEKKLDEHRCHSISYWSSTYAESMCGIFPTHLSLCFLQKNNSSNFVAYTLKIKSWCNMDAHVLDYSLHETLSEDITSPKNEQQRLLTHKTWVAQRIWTHIEEKIYFFIYRMLWTCCNSFPQLHLAYL